MAFLNWDETLDVYVDSINDEHKQLISIMNDLYELAERKSARAIIAGRLGDLGKATQKHFASEEAHMERIRYPKLSQHRHIHASLLKSFAEHVAAFEAGGELGNDFFYFLKVWLQSHIRGIDRQYSAAPAKTA